MQVIRHEAQRTVFFVCQTLTGRADDVTRRNRPQPVNPINAAPIFGVSHNEFLHLDDHQLRLMALMMNA